MMINNYNHNNDVHPMESMPGGVTEDWIVDEGAKRKDSATNGPDSDNNSQPTPPRPQNDYKSRFPKKFAVSIKTRSSEEEDQGKRSCGKRFKRIVKQLIPLFLLVLITLLGAVVFYNIENKWTDNGDPFNSPANSKKNEEVTERILKIVNLTNSTTKVRYREEIKSVIRELRNNLTHSEEPWAFQECIFYAFTLYSTVGYGNRSPGDVLGQVTTCIYSVLSIPIALFAMINIGEFFAWVCRKFYFGFARMFRMCRGDTEKLDTNLQRKTASEKEQDQNDSELLNFPLSFFLFCTLIWILVISGILMIWENWDFWTSFYFIIISTTTIGLGDITPERVDYLVLSSMLVFFGLTIVSTAISVVQGKMEATMKAVKTSMDKAYQASLVAQEGKAEELSEDPALAEQQMTKLINQSVPGGSNLFRMLPEDQKEQMKQYFKKKAGMKTKYVQATEIMVETEAQIEVMTDNSDMQTDNLTEEMETQTDFVPPPPSFTPSPPPPPMPKPIGATKPPEIRRGGKPAAIVPNASKPVLKRFEGRSSKPEFKLY